MMEIQPYKKVHGSAFQNNYLNATRPVANLSNRSRTNVVSLTSWCERNFKKLPSQKIVYASTPIYEGSNFTWGEATKNCRRELVDLYIDGVFILSALQIEARIISTAKSLDEVRSLLGGRPLLVNSWYRPPAENRRVGGSLYSRHQYGDAVDIRSDYLSPRSIFGKLKSHVGGLGKYRSFVHID